MNSSNDVVKCDANLLSANANVTPDDDVAENEQMLATQNSIDTSSALDLQCGIWIFRGPSLQRYNYFQIPDENPTLFIKY